MSILEEDISILIPTYRYREKVRRAVESALTTGAGEIIVTDDHSGDGTMETLASYRDSRLKVFENPVNLGLWENHLTALQHATRPWIKFIQADDYLLPGGLAIYAAGAGPGVNVVWSNPVVRDDVTGITRYNHEVTQPWRLTGDEYLELAIRSCWVLGSPSQMMLRGNAVVREPAAWTTEISADIIFAALAVRQGDVVLLPAGGMVHSEHAGQDSVTQGRGRYMRRLVATVRYLLDQPDPALRRFGALWAAQHRPAMWRAALGGTLRRQIGPWAALKLALHNEVHARSHVASARDRRLLRDGRAFRRHDRQPHDIGGILARDILGLPERDRSEGAA